MQRSIDVISTMRKGFVVQKISTWFLVIGLAFCSITNVTSKVYAAPIAKESSAMQITFNDSAFLHRWSKAGQNEFTQKDETDLNNWKQMVTIIVYPSVKDGEHLAATASNVVENYKAHGKIIKTDSKPRTPEKPAEHLAVAVLGTPKFLEAVFARFVLVDGTGIAVIYSHRIYGTAAGPQMSTWLHDTGPVIEKSLMAWDKIPKIADLEKLPQSSQ
jgi:hypothetical protein